MHTGRFRTGLNNRLIVAALGAVCVLLEGLFVPSSTETAVANGDTRTIHFYHTHTGESIDATFRVDGRYDQAVLDKLNHFLRDWRNDDQIRMDPRLFDTVWEVYRTAGADQPIQIYSAYRSPQTNAMLRRRSRAVAEHSQHILGKAMDTTMPGMSMERIREIAMKLQRGGVGYYQSANFVHIDVGGVRSWPRMPYDQLAQLFPDGKTVHIPSNGQPMARYEEARAEIAARGEEAPPAQESQGFFAWLFGGPSDSAPTPRSQTAMAYVNNTEGDEVAAAVGSRPTERAMQTAPQATPQPVPQPVVVATAEPVAEAAAQTPQANDIPLEASSELVVLPVPPRRPVELLAAADVLPVPPTRMDATFRLQVASASSPSVPVPTARPAIDAIGGLITASTQRSNLPAIITQGLPHRIPAPALAFAAMEPTSSLRPSLRDAALHAPTPARGLGLRAVSKAMHGQGKVAAKPAAAVALADVPVPVALPATSIYGLRRAAQALTPAQALTAKASL